MSRGRSETLLPYVGHDAQPIAADDLTQIVGAIAHLHQRGDNLHRLLWFDLGDIGTGVTTLCGPAVLHGLGVSCEGRHVVDVIESETDMVGANQLHEGLLHKSDRARITPMHSALSGPHRTEDDPVPTSD